MFGRIGALLAFRRNIRLAWRLARDPRVPLRTKLILPAAVGYLLFPVDLLPDFFPAVGQIDDFTMILLSLMAFLRLAPSSVVRDHLARMAGRSVPPSGPPNPGGKVVDGDYEILD